MAVAPATPGTGGGATAGSTTSAYPYGAVNGSDVWEANGATTYTTIPVILPAAATTAIIAATTGKKVKIVAMSLSASGAAGTVQLQDEGTPTKLTGVYGCLQNTSIVLPFNPAGWATTLSGAAVDGVTVGASAVFGGTITFCLI